jgi:hypothetical protein
MKKVALFSTYCDNEEKESTLLNNVRKVKSLGLDVFVLSILPLPKEIYEEADYVIHSKENPIASLDEKSICSWRICKNNVKILSFFPDYGYASLLQLKRLIDFSSALNYDYYFTMIYDIIITPEIERVLVEGRDCSFFKNPKVDKVLGGILTAFNKEHAKLFASLLTRDSYYGRSALTAEEWMIDANSFICGKIEDIYAADSINLADALLSTNHSPFADFNLFIIKDLDVKLFFYDLKIPIKLIIETNINRFEIEIADQKLVYIHHKSEEIKYIKINYEGVEKNISDYFDIIIRTKIEGYDEEIIGLS